MLGCSDKHHRCRRDAAAQGREQSDGQHDRQLHEDAQQDEGHEGRLAAAANGQVPGDGGQAGADHEVPGPVAPVQIQDRQQLVAARERRHDDRKRVVLDQHDRNHQAQAGREVAHGRRIGSSAFVEDPDGVQVQRAEDEVGQGDEGDADVGVLLQTVRMQGTHQFAGGVEVGGEVVDPKERHSRQQPDLAGTMDVGVFGALTRRRFPRQEDHNDQQAKREHSLLQGRQTVPVTGRR